MMQADTLRGGRPQTRAEVLADAVLHVIGLTGAVIGAAVLVTLAGTRGGALELAVMLVYAFGLLAMLGCSLAYNLGASGPRAELLRRFDHSAIFIMIAATYTPFTMLWLEGAWAITMTATVWAVALTGVLAKLMRAQRFEPLTIPLYIGLGWLGLLTLGPLLRVLGAGPVVLLLAGGTIYTLGIVFHLWRQLPFHNAIWHGCVISAALVHYLALITGVLNHLAVVG